MLKNLSIRRAISLDAIDIFKWRNDPKVKRGALNKSDCDLKEHYAWIDRQIKNGTLFIAHIDNAPLGVVCFYREDPGVYTWSFYLVPEQQHKAFGLTLMDIGMLIARNVLGAKRVHAEVEHVNRRSRELHKKLGFIEAVEGPSLSVFIKEL